MFHQKINLPMHEFANLLNNQSKNAMHSYSFSEQTVNYITILTSVSYSE